MSGVRRHGLTLIELLVSIALVATVVAAATTAFFQMLATTQRMQARQAMDAAARAVFERLDREISAMHPCAAVWLVSDASGSIELVFMRGKEQPYDYPELAHSYGTHKPMGFTDHVWSRWAWSATDAVLTASEGRSGRWFQVAADRARGYWQIPGGSRAPANYRNTFLSVPRLRRETGIPGHPNDPAAVLDRNAWGTGEPDDLGDHQDLLANARPLLFDCTGCVIEVLSLDGTATRADGRAPVAWAAPGAFVDGRSHAGSLRRPSVIRLRFTLDDPRTGASARYSFSFRTPAPMRLGGPTS